MQFFAYRTRLILLSGIVAALFSGVFALPVPAFAQVSIIASPLPNPPGITTYNGVGGDPNDCTNLPDFAAYTGGHCNQGSHPYLQNILNDIIGTGGLRTTALSRSMRYPDAYWSGQGVAGHPDVQPTIDRMCLATFPADTSLRATSFKRPGSNGGGTANGDERTTMAWMGSYWQLYKTNNDYVSGSDWNRVVSALTCTSYAPPHPTIMLSTFTINEGESAQLSWNDDQWNTSSSDACTATNFTPPVTIPGHYEDGQCTDWENSGSCAEAAAGLALVDGGCTRTCVAHEQVWVPDHTAPSGFLQVSPTQTTTYAYSCSSPNGTTVAQATLNVIPKAGTTTPPLNPVITSFTANPTTIQSGASSKLTWSSQNADSCAAADFSTGGATSNATGVSVSPTATHTYGLTCSNAHGQDTKYATVTVTNPDPGLAPSCSPGATSSTVRTPVSWFATATGGTGSYSYVWTLTGGTPATATGASASTTYALAGTYSGSVTVTSGSESKTVSCDSSVTVTLRPAGPDLTAGMPITEDGAEAGTPMSFSAGIQNIGGTATGNIWFPNMFQIRQQNADGSWGAYSDPMAGTPLNNIAAGDSDTTNLTLAWTPDAAGQYGIRACADEDTSWHSAITESREDNNCGPDYEFTVQPANPNTNITGSCSVSPDSGYLGDTFTWSVGSVSGGNGTYAYSWSGDDELSGTGTQVQKTYDSPGDKSASVTVTSGPDSKTIPCSSKATVNGPGQPFCTLHPEDPSCTTGGNFCLAHPTDPSCNYCAINPTSPFCTTGGDFCASHPTDPSCTYCAAHPTDPICTNSSLTPTASLTSDLPSVLINHGTMLHWSSTNASSCIGTGFTTGGAKSGSVPTGNLTTAGPVQYTVQCAGGPGTTPGFSSIIITVRNPKLSLTAAPNPVRKGQPTHLVWSATDAGSCHLRGPDGSVLSSNNSGTADPIITQQSTFTLACDSATQTVDVGIVASVIEI